MHWALAAASVLAVWLGRRLAWRPRDMHERLIGVTLILMVLSSLLRASSLWTWYGPYESQTPVIGRRRVLIDLIASP